MAKAKTKQKILAEQKQRKKSKEIFPEAYDVLTNIMAQCISSGYSDSAIIDAHVFGSQDTYTNRKKTPTNLKLGEIIMFSRVLGVSFWELIVPREELDKIIRSRAYEIAEIAEDIAREAISSAARRSTETV